MPPIPFAMLQPLSHLVQELGETLQAFHHPPHQSTLWVCESGKTRLTDVQVLETPLEICLRMSLPNLVDNHLELQLSAETVRIQGCQYVSGDAQVGAECSPQPFQSIIPFPSLVEPEAAIAQIENGVLILTLRKVWPACRIPGESAVDFNAGSKILVQAH